MAVQVRTPTRSASRLAQGRRFRRRWILRLAITLMTVLTLLSAAFGVLLVATPSVRDAPARVAAILAAHHAPGDHGVIPYKVASALLATEDSRFYSDPSIDPRGALRAMWGIVISNPNEGGATIEVQLAKLLYTPHRSDPMALAEQVALATKMDMDFTKKQILAMYLDAAYFGDGAYGVTAAAERYFGKPPSALDWAQATLIAGLVQAPSAYDPAHHLSLALARRDHVLARLVAVGTLSPARAKAIEAEPLHPAIPFTG